MLKQKTDVRQYNLKKTLAEKGNAIQAISHDTLKGRGRSEDPRKHAIHKTYLGYEHLNND